MPDLLTADPLTVEQKDDCLVIGLPEHFRDKVWADDMGFVQKEIGRYANAALATKETSRQVEFDFSLCRWVDPLPLMSVLLEIVNVRQLEIPVLIRLPEPDADPEVDKRSSYQKSPNLLLLFLANGGFFDCLKRLNDGGISCFPKPEGGWDSYRSLNFEPTFEDVRAVPMHIFFLPKEGGDKEFVKNSVEEFLRGIDLKLESKIPPQSRERFIHKLYLTLQELIHNVQEHAYEQSTTRRPVVIYVRHRTGGLRLDFTGEDRVLNLMKEEQKHCPRLEKEWLALQPGCLEMFVLDRGIGMVQSFEKAGIELEWKHKLSGVVYKTFIDGHSTKKDHQTRFGGLHLLHNLLIKTGDYLRILDDATWFGCTTMPITKSMGLGTAFLALLWILASYLCHPCQSNRNRKVSDSLLFAG